MPSATREALIVACSAYTDPALSRLKTPGKDAESLAEVLSAPDIGGYTVRTVLNEPAHIIRRRIQEFFVRRGTEDQLLVYFSCHGIKDDDGHLYFAGTDTDNDPDLLDSGAVAASFLNTQLNRCRARRIAVLLDCCYSGAFHPGTKGDGQVHLADQLTGRGMAVLTATNALQYAWEGDGFADQGPGGGGPQLSLFTSAIVEGLRQGTADVDGDGQVSVDDLYSYVHDRLRDHGARQTPRKWLMGVEGSLVIALSTRRRPAELPGNVRHALAHVDPAVRLTVVEELKHLAGGGDGELARLAKSALETLTDDDSRKVSAAATATLGREEPADQVPAQPGRAETVLAGIGHAAGLIRRTLGPTPRPALVIREDGSVVRTTDPLAIVRESAPRGGMERLGADLVTGLVTELRQRHGDGSATAVVAFHAMVRALQPSLGRGVHPVLLSRSVPRVFAEADDQLSCLGRGAPSKEDVIRVVSLAIDDDAITKAINKALVTVGSHGFIEVKRSDTHELKVMSSCDIRIASGYGTPGFATMKGTDWAHISRSLVLVADRVLSMNVPVPALETAVPVPSLGKNTTEGIVTRWLKNGGELVKANEPLLEMSIDEVTFEVVSPVSGTLISIKVAEDETAEVGETLALISSLPPPPTPLEVLLRKVGETGKPLFVLARAIEKSVVDYLLAAANSEALRSIPVVAPGHGERQQALLGDVAIRTGATIITEASGLGWDNVGLDMLGHAHSVIALRSVTDIMCGATGSGSRSKERINEIRSEMQQTDSRNRECLRERLAMVGGSRAVIMVGDERSTAVENALRITWATVDQGVLPGGAAALCQVAKDLTDGRFDPVSAEGQIRQALSDALREPMRAIVENNGGSLDTSEDIWDSLAVQRAIVEAIGKATVDYLSLL